MPKIFTSPSLCGMIDKKLAGYTFIIISNREPYSHVRTDKGIKCKVPAGGVTAALDPMMRACSGLWIAGGWAGDADKETVDAHDRVKVPPGRPEYVLRRVWINEQELDEFYYGFSNQILWSLCHPVFGRPVFKNSFWEGYKKINKRYADVCLEEVAAKKKAIVFLQDYHLALAAQHIKAARPELPIVLFWHIPWPHPDVMSTCPWVNKIIEGLLANDLLGFQTKEYCLYFLDSAQRELGAKINTKRLTVTYKGHTTQVRVFPISVDYDAINRLAKNSDVVKELAAIRKEFPHKFIGVGVDRVDYSKGIPERLKAIDLFFEKWPHYQNEFVYVELGAPSRTKIPAYDKINKEIDTLIASINKKYAAKWPRWRPIVYIYEKVPFSRVLAFYSRADLCIVSSLKDGMNIVAKEFVAAQTKKNGVLILSKFAGAAQEMRDAIINNPYDIDAFALAIKRALEMSPKEKAKRMASLRKQVRTNNIYTWMAGIISAIAQLEKFKRLQKIKS